MTGKCGITVASLNESMCCECSARIADAYVKGNTVFAAAENERVVEAVREAIDEALYRRGLQREGLSLVPFRGKTEIAVNAGAELFAFNLRVTVCGENNGAYVSDDVSDINDKLFDTALIQAAVNFTDDYTEYRAFSPYDIFHAAVLRAVHAVDCSQDAEIIFVSKREYDALRLSRAVNEFFMNRFMLTRSKADRINMSRVFSAVSLDRLINYGFDREAAAAHVILIEADADPTQLCMIKKLCVENHAKLFSADRLPKDISAVGAYVSDKTAGVDRRLFHATVSDSVNCGAASRIIPVRSFNDGYAENKFIKKLKADSAGQIYPLVFAEISRLQSRIDYETSRLKPMTDTERTIAVITEARYMTELIRREGEKARIDIIGGYPAALDIMRLADALLYPNDARRLYQLLRSGFFAVSMPLGEIYNLHGQYKCAYLRRTIDSMLCGLKWEELSADTQQIRGVTEKLYSVLMPWKNCGVSDRTRRFYAQNFEAVMSAFRDECRFETAYSLRKFLSQPERFCSEPEPDGGVMVISASRARHYSFGHVIVVSDSGENGGELLKSVLPSAVKSLSWLTFDNNGSNSRERHTETAVTGV